MAEIWGLAAIVLMEVVLSVDNVLFLSLIGLRLPAEKQKTLWRLWLLWSPLLRVGLLALLLTILRVEGVALSYGSLSLTWRGVLLSVGGLFLMYKAVRELYHHIELVQKSLRPSVTFWAVLGQAFLVDLLFSVDSVLTAIGLARKLWVAAAAVVASILVMALAGQGIQAFIQRHRSFQVLGLAFLLLIGFMLFVEGIHVEVPRGYVYFAMFFAFSVEVLQLWIQKREQLQEVSERE
jgi:predicted tellurium resistance membrane protein TerC